MLQWYIKRASDRGVSTLVNVGTTIEDSRKYVDLALQYSHLFAVVGLHPTEVTSDWPDKLLQLKPFCMNKKKYKVVGIGECGIDLFHKNETLNMQKDAFKSHIEYALQYDLALVVHSRNAYDQTLRTLEPYVSDLKRVVFHCFSYDKAFSDQVEQWGFLMGIGGPITYPKNQVLRDVFTSCRESSFVLETDAPFLPVQSMRGKQNEPQHIADIALFIAQLRGVSVDYIDNITTANAERLFRFSEYT